MMLSPEGALGVLCMVELVCELVAKLGENYSRIGYSAFVLLIQAVFVIIGIASGGGTSW